MPSALPEVYVRGVADVVDARRLADAAVTADVKALAEAKAMLADVQAAQSAAQAVAQSIQQQMHEQLAGVVTRALAAVFDDPYEFRIVFEQKRGKTEAALQFARGGVVLDDPLAAAGGGAVDVAAFALRCAALVLSRPALRRVLVLDEPFRFVSTNYRARVRELLLALSVELDVQFIMVTHFTDLAVGRVVGIT